MKTKTQTLFTKSFSFVDAKRNKVELDAEITMRNGYPEFTISGNYQNGGGQVIDSIKPANKAQKQLIFLWKKHHLKQVYGDFQSLIESVIAEIIDNEDERKGKPLSKLSEDELLKLIDQETTFSGRDAELCAAFVRMFDLSENDLQDVEIDGNRSTVQGVEYLAGDDSEMDDEWDNDLENYIDECLIPDLPETAQMYFDREKWKRDARIDGRAHSLNRYDGGEEHARINDTDYYAYRQ